MDGKSCVLCLENGNDIIGEFILLKNTIGHW